MTSASRDRFAEVVRAERVDLALACALIGVEVDADLDADAVVALLDDLAADVLRDVPADEPPSSVATALGRALGGRLGYCGTPEDYADLRSSLLHEVLRRRRGLPILLSVMYLEVGARLGLLVEGIGVPGHFVVGVTDGVERALLDPFAGGTPTTVRELAERAARGGAMPPLGDADLQAWGPVDILTRVLGNIRALSTSAESLRTQLWAVELSLLLPRHPASLRRERGQLLARLGDFVRGARELEEYADVVAATDPGAAELSRRQAQLVRSRLS